MSEVGVSGIGESGAAVPLSQDEAFARIRLLRSPNIGPVSYRQLLRRFGSAVVALEALPDLAARGGAKYRAAPTDRIEREIEAAKRCGARYLFHDMESYPPLLAESDGAPPIVTWRGDIALALRPSVAIVGARNASAAAVKLAREFAAALGEAGLVVVSGLARGIDGAAHEASLSTGTIGVIASGIDVAYPPEHAALQERIATDGLLLAEEPPGTDPLARHFPRRNRIIAGLSAGTLVVEAAPKSGSLITARLAGEAGREVMAIPGSPLDSRSHGCNQLIRDGAILVQRPEDVIEQLAGFDGIPHQRLRESEPPDIAPREAEPDIDPGDIASLLSLAPVPVDELVRQSGASAGQVQGALLDLEIAGQLIRHSGGRVSLSA